MISIIGFERNMANICIFGIIVGKLRHRKKICSIILFKVDKKPKLGFHYTILTLGKAACLRFESG